MTSGKNQGFYCVIRPSSDSKIKLLINQTCQFVTFINPAKPDDESPILASVNNIFHLFAPDGTRIKKIPLIVNGRDWEKGIKVLYCSDFCDFFIFENIPYLFLFCNRNLTFTQMQKIVPKLDFYKIGDSFVTEPSMPEIG